MFTATWTQLLSYLFGVCLFSISFLVFLNSSVSFVITDLIGKKDGVGNAVGTLGFVDELVALLACPLWGMASDRIGVRSVCVLGYAIVGLALFLFVQASNVFPQLLLARIFFSLGGAATSTMVTAVLPSMVSPGEAPTLDTTVASASGDGPLTPPSTLSEVPITQHRHRRTNNDGIKISAGAANAPSTTRVAGFVGLFTGCGALVALGLFLPLPAFFGERGVDKGSAVAYSYYTVGTIAFIVCLVCILGLRNLRGEETKSWSWHHKNSTKQTSSPKVLLEAINLGFTTPQLALAYIGGFVARASSVGISLFIPLYVNAYFVSSNRCRELVHSPGEVKEGCRRAYILAAELSGVSQLIALLFAPVFGYLADRSRRFNIPLLLAAIAGIIGYLALALLRSPEPSGPNGTPAVFIVVCLLGISQIGSIVCSLGLLGRYVLTPSPRTSNSHGVQSDSPRYEVSNSSESCREVAETSNLLRQDSETYDTREHIKGSIAGVYSLAGGAGILLLTKLGGYLFDVASPSAPFYMLSGFNGILLLFGLGCGISETYNNNHKLNH